MLKRNGAGLWAGKADLGDELLFSGIVLFPPGEKVIIGSWRSYKSVRPPTWLGSGHPRRRDV